MMTRLEQYEARTGTHHTREHWFAALERKAYAPASLTDLDCMILNHFGGPAQEAEAINAHGATIAPPIAPPEALITKGADLGLKAERRKAAKDRAEARMAALAAAIGTGIKRALEPRDQKIANLEQRNASLAEQVKGFEARIVELEADKAARTELIP